MKMFRVSSGKTECFIVAESADKAVQMFLDEIGGDPMPEEMPQDSTFSAVYDQNDVNPRTGPVPGLDVPADATVEPYADLDGQVVEWWVEALVSEWCELHETQAAIVMRGDL